MRPYPDTSFLFSLYIADANTPAALTVRHTYPAPLPVTAFHRMEMRNAFGLAVFRKQLAQSSADAAWRYFETDLENGVWQSVSVAWSEAFREAERLAVQHTATEGSRSLDILHVAAARLLGADLLITFDVRQGKLAAKAALGVNPIPAPF